MYIAGIAGENEAPVTLKDYGFGASYRQQLFGNGFSAAGFRRIRPVLNSTLKNSHAYTIGILGNTILPTPYPFREGIFGHVS